MTNSKLIKNKFAGALAFGALVLLPTAKCLADGETVLPARDIPFSVGIEAGTTGAGANAAWRFCNYLGIESGVDYFQYNYNGNIKDNHYDAKLKLASVPVNLEVFPWKHSSFHISLGALINENRLTGDAGPGTINLGNGYTYTGTLALNYKPQAVDPYVGIGGNLYFDHAHHFSLMGALGVAYAGDGRVHLTANPAQTTPAGVAAVQNEQTRIEHYGSYLKYWPVIKIGFTYSF